MGALEDPLEMIKFLQGDFRYVGAVSDETTMRTCMDFGWAMHTSPNMGATPSHEVPSEAWRIALSPQWLRPHARYPLGIRTTRETRSGSTRQDHIEVVRGEFDHQPSIDPSLNPHGRHHYHRKKRMWMWSIIVKCRPV